MLRWTIRILGGLLALVLLFVIGGGIYAYYEVHASFPQVSGTLKVQGLQHPVTVIRDEHGIPQVYAQDTADLYFAQGYIHSQDRFWEMDFRRHVTAGRLSELFGKDQIETDEFIRTMGWRRVAAVEYARASATTRAYLQDYAKGVNAWLGQQAKGGGVVPVKLGAKSSLEYRLLGLQNSGYKVEPWTPVDSVAWLKAMAWDLRANMTDELTRSLVSGLVGPARTLQLYPAYPYAIHRTVVTQGTAVNGKYNQNATPSGPPVAAAVVGAPPGANAALKHTRALLIQMAGIAGQQTRGLGSNSWVVSGALTATGKPLLSNDPHLDQSVPGIWYQMGLHCTQVSAACPYNMAGYTFSGLPGIVIGHNSDIGWGFTNLTSDVSDLFLEKVSGNSYIVDGKKHPLTLRREVIQVAGGSPVTITVRSTDHGPILSDVAKDYRQAGEGAPTIGTRPGGYAVSLEWTALKPGHTIDAIRLLDGAHDWTQFKAAAALFDVPAQNLVYADVKGNIGYQTPGWIPTRAGWNGDWPAPGWLSTYHWTGRIPFAALPSVYNPREGFAVTANNAVVVPQYPYPTGTDYDFGYRAQRIADLLNKVKKAGPITVAELQKIQTDTYNGNAGFLVPALAKAGLLTGYDSKTQAAVDVMKKWDLRNDSTSAGALVFNVFWSHLLADSFDTQLPKDYHAAGDDRWAMVVRTLWNRPSDAWWNNAKTAASETRNDSVRAAMKSAASYIESKFGSDASSWQWGKLHQLNLKNPTFGSSGIGPIEWLFNRGPYNVAGGPAIVNAISWNAADGYTVDAVPSMRQVLDVSNWDHSTWVQLTGNSGHAFNSWYVDQTPLWQNGTQFAWPFSRSAVETAGKHTLTLEPSS